jgi:spermidine synthase
MNGKKKKTLRNVEKKHSGAGSGKSGEGKNSFLFALILGFFFLSGMTGLIYEILWTRYIVKIIGGAPFAVSIVLTVFMGGLGLGSYLASRKIDRVAEPKDLVKLYGVLEIMIGLYGLMLPFLLIIFKPLYSLLYNTLFGHFFIYNFFTFAGCTILLLFPAACMGATLPVLSRFYATNMPRMGSQLGRLYGINTLGAVMGSFLCGFFIINLWGVAGSLMFAVAINIIIGVSSLYISAGLKPAHAQTGMSDVPEDSPENCAPNHAELIGRGALAIFAVSGFCAMAYEVIWIKLLGLLVGPTTYSFTIVLLTFISGLALGSIFFGWLGDITGKPVIILIFTQLAAALCALFVSQILGNSQIFFAKLIDAFKGDFTQLIMVKSAFLFGFMFFPTFFLGATFPLVGKIYTRSAASVGRSIGFAYSINTLGAVLGSFCAGFLFVPYFGKETALSLMVILQLSAAFFYCCLVFRMARKPIRQWVPYTMLAAAGILCALVYPRWDRDMLSFGKYHRFEVVEVSEMGWLKSLLYGNEFFEKYMSGEIVYFGDGAGGFTTVKRDTDILGNINYSLMNSGKSDASTVGGDMATQTLLAHFPMVYHPAPDTVLVLGLASGITAGEVLHYPVEKLDVLDINSQVVEASGFFTPWNNDLMSDPRTELIIQDGRAHLELTNRSYDVIISEPSNPWMAGLATLFTYEFFELVKDRLHEGGIFCQWIHAYQIDWNNFALVGRTFSEVFPNSILVGSEVSDLSPDYLLIGFNGEIDTGIETALKNLPYIQSSKNLKYPNHEIFHNLITNENMKHLFGDGVINTDNRPRLEFDAPKLMHAFDQELSRNIATRKWTGPETERIARLFSTDISRRIDLAEYYLSFDQTTQVAVDISQAGQQEKEKYARVVKTYCTEKYVPDFSFIADDELRSECILIQIGYMLEIIGGIEEKGAIQFHLGGMYYELGMLDEAITSFSDVLKIDPDIDVVHYNLGKILSLQGKFDEAIVHYKDVIRINPGHLLALNNYGNLLVKRGEISEAVGLYRDAIRRDKTFALAHKNLGAVLKSIGKREEGEAHYQEALRLEQKSATLYK